MKVITLRAPAYFVSANGLNVRMAVRGAWQFGRQIAFKYY